MSNRSCEFWFENWADRHKPPEKYADQATSRNCGDFADNDDVPGVSVGEMHFRAPSIRLSPANFHIA